MSAVARAAAADPVAQVLTGPLLPAATVGRPIFKALLRGIDSAAVGLAEGVAQILALLGVMRSMAAVVAAGQEIPIRTTAVPVVARSGAAVAAAVLLGVTVPAGLVARGVVILTAAAGPVVELA